METALPAAAEAARAPRRPLLTAAGLRSAGGNVALAALNLAFATAHLRAFSERPRASVAAIVALELVVAVLALVRRDATAASTTAWAWATTLLGTYGALLLRPAPGASDVLAGVALQLAGMAGALLGAVALNRSFGLLPARRGVRTGGAYRIVRHPLYASYLVAHVGYCVNHPTAANLAVVAAVTAAQVARIVNEERLLSADPAYAAYRRATRWRLVPFIF